ncbi:MAG TPA: hypothetical protein DEB38_03805 [Acidimicrobiaceae bacterium]|nr:hypothetical protein [Acidimicrobiaceae bacterium]
MTPQAHGVVTSFDAKIGLGEVDVDGVAIPFHCIAIADGSRNIEVGAEVTVSTTRRFGRVEASRVSRRAG